MDGQRLALQLEIVKPVDGRIDKEQVHIAAPYWKCALAFDTWGAWGRTDWVVSFFRQSRTAVQLDHNGRW
eukprot:316258-Pleurochrysis_carterae.AAC.7